MPAAARFIPFIIIFSTAILIAEESRIQRDFVGPFHVLTIENQAGATEIETWPDSRIRVIVAGPTGMASARLASAVLFEKPTPETLKILVARGSQEIHLIVYAPQNVRLSVRGQSEPVTIKGTLNGVSTETVSGRIVLYLPVNTNADVALHTIGGTVQSELPVISFGSSAEPGRLDGRIGQGGYPILLRSLEGPIRILPMDSSSPAPAESQITESSSSSSRHSYPADLDAGLIKVDVDLVNLQVKVTDRTGRTLPDLRKEDFLVFEDGTQQTVTYFEPTTAPISLVLLLDLSGSTEGKTRLIKKAAIKFIDALGSDDYIAVAAFTRRFMLVSRFTKDRRLLRERIDDLENRGSGTAYYDAMWATLDLLEDVPGARKAIVVMTDGVDNSLSHPERYSSRHDFDELLSRAAEEDPTIYPIYLDTEYDVVVNKRQDSHRSYATAIQQLQALADQTGGVLHRADRVEDLEGVYGRVASELRTVYSLGYVSSNRQKDGRWRKIDVRTRRPGVVARTRRGYYAK